MIFREEIGESLTLKFAEAANERKRNGLSIISLGLGEPDFDTPVKIVDAAVRILRSGNSVYSSPMGVPALRRKIADKLNADNAIPAKESNILVTAGAKQAFQMAAMALLEPGDEVIVLNPSFVSFIPQLLIAEPQCVIRAIDVNKEDFSIPLDEIKRAVTSKTKLVVLNSPNNPAGYLLNDIQLKQIFELANQYDFFILSDEIYEKLNFGQQPHFSIGSFESEVRRVFTVNGFSKSHAMTGWRLGYLCFPKQFNSRLLKLMQHTCTNTCTFIQQAVAEAFESHIESLAVYNNLLAERAAMVVAFAREQPNLSIVEPQAGFFAFLNISELNMDSNSFCGRLIADTGVATTPGIAFGENWDDHVRISFATDTAILRQGILLMKQFIQSLPA